MPDTIIYISVILPLRLEWEPCYWTDCPDIAAGQRVKVQFAHKEYTGVVSAVGIEPQTAPSRIMQITGIEEKMGRILPTEIEFWRYLAGYYMCSVGEVYKTAYPSAKINMEEIFLRKEEAAALRKARVQAAEERKAAAAKARAEKAMVALAAREEKIRARIARKRAQAERTKKDDDRIRLTGEIHGLETEITGIRQAMDRYTGLIAGHSDPMTDSSGIPQSPPDEATRTDTLPMTGPTKDPAEAAGSRTSSAAGELTSSPAGSIPYPVLSETQQTALEKILDAFPTGKTVLLNGVTGSGKTEIYTTLALRTLSEGKNVLYLVPEIAMSRQLEDRLRTSFGDRLLIFHSGRTAAQKAEAYYLVRNGRRAADGNGINARQAPHIILGTRSALFLPHHDLGLIIVDEEHDSSYKQDSPAPRYNGRDAALMLCRIQNSLTADGNGCNVILGSATPSLESMYNCSTGKYAEVRLDSRYYGHGKTAVEIVDTIAERKKRGMVGSFSRKLIFRMEQALENGRQIMLLRTRRGYSPVMQCSACGFIPKCPRCNVSLTYHKDTGRITCHHCGYAVPGPELCPECGGEFRALGAGTQKIEEEVRTLFPQARVARLDSDTARDNGYSAEAVRKFGTGETDILIGTQIITKGFDFGRLSLVAVLQADTMLGIQDFRADEKAVQTLEQLLGRCGRRGEDGIFVIQTSQPDHPVYRVLKDGNAGTISAVTGEFDRQLLAERHEFGYPPYTRIIDIRLKDRSESRADAMSDILASELDGYDVTGPYAPYSGKSSGEYIRMLRITLQKNRTLAEKKRILMDKIRKFESGRRYSGHIVIDVDPV